MMYWIEFVRMKWKKIAIRIVGEILIILNGRSETGWPSKIAIYYYYLQVQLLATTLDLNEGSMDTHHHMEVVARLLTSQAPTRPAV